MKLKLKTDQKKQKAGDMIHTNSEVQAQYMVNHGIAEMVDDTYTHPAFEGKNVYATEEQVKAENEKMQAYSVATTNPAPHVDKPEAKDAKLKK